MITVFYLLRHNFITKKLASNTLKHRSTFILKLGKIICERIIYRLESLEQFSDFTLGHFPILVNALAEWETREQVIHGLNTRRQHYRHGSMAPTHC